MDEKKDQISIPFLMEYMGITNRRMFHALLAVCLTFILTIIIFVVGYTVRESNWQNTVKEITRQTEVANGIQEQPNP
jgi:uncharacterized membrane protein YbjE (DUF340 family)